MKEIELDYKPKVFDDPKYCSDGYGCGYINEDSLRCELLYSYIKYEENGKYLKCDKCKEVYQKTKDKL